MSDAHPIEIWRTVPDYPAYEVSNCGQVRSYWKRFSRIGIGSWMVIGDEAKLLVPGVERTGHLHVTLGDGHGNQRTFKVAVLVLMAFDRTPEPGEVARHYHDPDPTNNNLWNLRWGTYAENSADIFRHKGKHSRAKLGPEQVADVLRRIRAGEPQKDIAADLGVSRSLITMIKQGKTQRIALAHLGELSDS